MQNGFCLAVGGAKVKAGGIAVGVNEVGVVLQPLQPINSCLKLPDSRLLPNNVLELRLYVKVRHNIIYNDVNGN